MIASIVFINKIGIVGEIVGASAICIFTKIKAERHVSLAIVIKDLVVSSSPKPSSSIN